MKNKEINKAKEKLEKEHNTSLHFVGGEENGSGARLSFINSERTFIFRIFVDSKNHVLSIDKVKNLS